MAFAVHINMERCTGCNNCVVACPVGALELFTEDPVTDEKIYRVKDGKALVLDFRAELCAGCQTPNCAASGVASLKRAGTSSRGG